MTDLAQDERWQGLLDALALSDVGVIGFDAAWAAKFANFWGSLRQYVEAHRCVVYIRNLFDYRDPQSCVSLLRVMPSSGGPYPIASTCDGSLWLSGSEEMANFLRRELNGSGLFAQASEELPSQMVIVSNAEYAAGFTNVVGWLPQFVYKICEQMRPEVSLSHGWHKPEADGCWTDGKISEISINLPSRALNGGEIRICGNAWISPVEPDQIIEFSTDKKKKNWSTTRLSSGDIVTIDLPVTADDMAKGSFAIYLKVNNPGRPSDHGSDDTRVLGFKLRSIMYYPT